MSKKFYLSKRFWGIVIAFIGGGLSAIGYIELGTYVSGIGLALTGYGSAVAKGSWSL